MPFTRSALTGSLLATVFCAAGPSGGSAPTPVQARAKPTLLVFITVDQLREDYLEKWRSQFTGGFKQLLDGGAFFTNGHQDHAITETAPGHASTMSGRFPRSTGITRNLAGVNDSTSPLIAGLGPGASPFRFRGSTLTDWLTARDPKTRALSVSFKDRGAILPIGRSRQEVYWYSFPAVFTASRWYRETLPEWVTAFNAQGNFAKYAGRIWDLLLPASNYPEPDSGPVESGGRNFTFPYRLSNSPDTASAQILSFPFLDEITGHFALRGLEALGLGKGPQTDVLAVSFSGTDLIGHRFGPDSRELHDQVLRLDRTIGAFLDSLYQLRDRNSIVIALTADHGVQPFPELNNGRITPAPLRVDLRPALTAAEMEMVRVKGDKAAVDFESGALFIDPARAKVDASAIQSVVDTFLAAARRIPGVLRTARIGELARADLGKDAIARRWVQMFPPDLPVQATVTLTLGSYWWYYGVAQHGTPHDPDTHVPILFFGAPFKPGRYPQFVRTVDIAPTLAQVLGVPPTEPLDGRVLTAVIK